MALFEYMPTKNCIKLLYTIHILVYKDKGAFATHSATYMCARHCTYMVYCMHTHRRLLCIFLYHPVTNHLSTPTKCRIHRPRIKWQLACRPCSGCCCCCFSLVCMWFFFLSIFASFHPFFGENAFRENASFVFAVAMAEIEAFFSVLYTI